MRMPVACWPLVLCALASLPDVLRGQTGGTPAGGTPRKRAHAVRLERQAVRVDGRLDDAVWGGAAWITDFVQKEPNEGAEPTERTAVAFFYDDEALYVGVRAHADDPARIQAPLSRRDNTSQAEHLWIS